jgi:hypothetical protein
MTCSRLRTDEARGALAGSAERDADARDDIGDGTDADGGDRVRLVVDTATAGASVGFALVTSSASRAICVCSAAVM